MEAYVIWTMEVGHRTYVAALGEEDCRHCRVSTHGFHVDGIKS